MNRIILTAFCLLFIQFQNLVCAQETNNPDKVTNTANSQILPYNFESTYKVPIKLGIVTPISTKGEKIYEGQTIQFKVLKDAYCRRKTFIKKDTIVNAKIETIITSGMNGFPAEIIVGHFEIPNTKPTQLVDTYIKKGQNRCYIVYPIKWALTIIPFVGSLTNFIMGGHAKIKTSDEVVIYYYPDWR